MNREVGSNAVLKPFHLCCATGMKSSQDTKSTPAFRLIEEYFYWMVDYLEGDKPDSQHVPFRIEHVKNALQMVLLNSAKERGVSLQINILFVSKFLLGKRMEVLVLLLHTLHSVIEQNKDCVVDLNVQYSADFNQLQAIIQAPVLDLGTGFNPFAVDITHQEGVLEMHFACTAIDYRSNEVQDVKRTISELEFPYLFNISGGDRSIAQDILETILESVSPDIDHLESAFRNSQWTDLERLTHKMKPNFSSVERKDLSQQLQRMEQYALEKNEADFAAELEQFIPVAKKVISELSKYEV